MSLAATRDDGVAPQTHLIAPAADTATKRILFVDRRRDTFEGLREALAPSGALWQVEYAAGGDEALALIEQAPADVVVADEQLTAMDGVTLLTRVRDRHPSTIRMIMSGATKPGLAT
ncbi:MAG TPA: response regulator, partial [Solirubrobacteraceae bacterium]